MSLIHDIRASVRAARRAPRIAAAAILCTALGVTAVGAVLTLLVSTLVRPLPFPDSDRLVRVWLHEPGVEGRRELAFADIRDIEEGIDAFDRFEATRRARLLFIGAEEGGRRVEGEAVTSGYFDLLGVRAQRGRLFDTAEYGAGGPGAIVLSHAAWGSIFDFAPDVVGRTIRTFGAEYVIVGVMEPTFNGTIEEDNGDIEFWIPIEGYVTGQSRTRRDVTSTWAIGRLGEGRTLAQARSQLGGLSRRIALIDPTARDRLEYTVERFGENWRESLRAGGSLLLVAALLLLLIAAFNTAGLLTARAFERRRELAIRVALGAARSRTARLLLLETLVLVAAGGVLGFALGPAVLSTFFRLAPVQVPDYVSRSPDPVMLLVAFVVIGIAGLAAGLIPALLGSRVDVMRAVREAGRGAIGGRTERRAGAALVIAEVAITVVLTVSSGLLLRSWSQLSGADLGFRTAGVAKLALFPGPQDAADDAGRRALNDRVRDALLARPDVEAVGRVWPTVTLWSQIESRIGFDGMPADWTDQGLVTGIYAVDREFLETLEIPLIAGRLFDGSDRTDGAPVALVSESVARAMGAIERATGTELDIEGDRVRVIGVVGDAQFTGPRAPAADARQVYLLLDQTPVSYVTFVVAGRGGVSASLPVLRRTIAEAAPGSAIDWVEPVDEAVRMRSVSNRFLLYLIGTFSGAALLLAAVGLFAVLANLVATGHAEFALRQALGASPVRVLAHVVRRGLALVITGLAIGMVVTLPAVRLLDAALFGVGRFDRLSWAGTAAVLLTVALLASWLPARRASSIEPMDALR